MSLTIVMMPHAFAQEFTKSTFSENIVVVYVVAPVKNEELYRYIDRDCFTESDVAGFLKKLDIKKCNAMKTPS